MDAILEDKLRTSLRLAHELRDVAGVPIPEVEQLEDDYQELLDKLAGAEADIKAVRPGKDFEARVQALMDKKARYEVMLEGTVNELIDQVKAARVKAFVEVRPVRLAELEQTCTDCDQVFLDKMAEAFDLLLHRRVPAMRDLAAAGAVFAQISYELQGEPGVYFTGAAPVETPFKKSIALVEGDTGVATTLMEKYTHQIAYLINAARSFPSDPGARMAWFSQPARRV